MTPPHGVPLTQTGEHDAVEDASPDELDAMSKVHASKAFVVNMCKACWVKRWVRGVRLKWAFALGFVAAVQIIGAFAIRSMTETAVRKAVVEVLKERKLIAAEEVARAESHALISQAHADERKSP